eukprot:scaffold234289_cov37-Tisochrysis_lutea.AAC.1
MRTRTPEQSTVTMSSASASSTTKLIQTLGVLNTPLRITCPDKHATHQTSITSTSACCCDCIAVRDRVMVATCAGEASPFWVTVTLAVGTCISVRLALAMLQLLRASKTMQ